MRSRPVQQDDIKKPDPSPKKSKMIKKEEGEYVEFEEMKD
jgi:hypothetical protein